MMTNKRDFRLGKFYGIDEYGFAALPEKVSNVRIARIIHAEDRGGCTICFPHGFETTNATIRKNKKSWKCKRSKQYKGVEMY